MRTLMKITVPVQPGNVSIQEGRLPGIIEQLFARIKPEAAYFYAAGGQRSAFVVFDLKDPADIPPIAEPLFMGVNASIEFLPVMNAEDLRKGLQAVAASAAAAPAASRSAVPA